MTGKDIEEIMKTEPLFLADGDRVCYKNCFFTVLGSFASRYNNRCAVIHSLRDKHFHIYDIVSDKGEEVHDVPREHLQFLSRGGTDDHLLYACWGLMRKFKNLPTTYPGDLLDDNTEVIPVDTWCLFVDYENQAVFNAKVIEQLDFEDGTINYIIRLENGLEFTNVPHDILYINSFSYYFPNGVELPKVDEIG